MLGWDHCDAGRRLVADWKLPSECDSIVSEHHAPSARMVRGACRSSSR